MTRTITEIQMMLNGQDFLKQFVSDLRADINELGGDDQIMYDAIKSDSKLRGDFARLIVADSEKPKLIPVTKGTKITEPSFSKFPFFAGKKPFFGKKGTLVKFYFGGGEYSKRLMEEIPSIIPPLSITLRQDEFVKYARYSRWMKELGDPEPLNVSEFASVIHNLLLERPEGEFWMYKKYLSDKTLHNLFPVKLSNGKLLVVAVYWSYDEWSFYVHKIVNDQYHLFAPHSCIFSRLEIESDK